MFFTCTYSENRSGGKARFVPPVVVGYHCELVSLTTAACEGVRCGHLSGLSVHQVGGVHCNYLVVDSAECIVFIFVYSLWRTILQRSGEKKLLILAFNQSPISLGPIFSSIFSNIQPLRVYCHILTEEE